LDIVSIALTKTFSGRARGAFLVAVSLLLAGCGDGEAAPQPGGGRGGPGSALPAAVETGLVEIGTISRDVTVSGVVEPIRTIAVNSQLSGALLSVEVEEGMAVRAGQVLARVDDRELAAQEASAEAAFAVAQAAFERAEQLRERQVITIGEYERDRTAYASARAQLEQLRTRRGYAIVRAPLNGIVLEQRVEAGDLVAPQTQLFRIGDVSTMIVLVSVSELDVVELAPGETATLMFDAFPSRTFQGRIRRIFPAADPGTRLVPVEVALDGAGAATARPGFLARVTFALGARTGVRLVPSSALVSGAGGQAVFTVENGRALRRTVQTGLTSQGRIEVLSGLEAGDTIVVTGGNTLRDGAEVRVVQGPGSNPSAGRESPGESANPASGGES
jgi:RND family efflux transporter MFP subunit